jgi:hypothetical protein
MILNYQRSPLPPDKYHPLSRNVLVERKITGFLKNMQSFSPSQR